MPDEEFRELTPEQLRALSIDDIGAAVLRHVRWIAHGTAADDARVLRTLAPGIRAIYTTVLVDLEVNEGGFARFLLGPLGRLGGEALASYELLGAEDYAAVMRAAIATREAERSRLHAGTVGDQRETGAAPSPFDEVDQRYYALGDRLYAIWAAVVQRRPELFEE